MAQTMDGGAVRDAARVIDEAEWASVASVATYEEAANAVDFLADAHFPTDRTAIAARDLTLVDLMAGRPSAGRTATSGALTGAVVGALVGLLSEAFDDGAYFGGLVLGLLVGAAAGLALGLALRSRRGGDRPGASASAVHAERYEVLVQARLAEEARTLLTEWTLARPSRRAPGGG